MHEPHLDQAADRESVAAACPPGPNDLLAFASVLRARYESLAPAAHRKANGQFTTPPQVARFMASLLPSPPERLTILDPGAGVGMLSAAICDRLARLSKPRHLTLHLFETDSKQVPLLEQNMEHCRAALSEAGHVLLYTIHNDDFILDNQGVLSQHSLFIRSQPLPRFDAVLMNPPYFKIGGRSEYARIAQQIVHGQPNIYALFLALGAELLRPGGDLVAITPRSFCNGLYFRGFRRWFFQRMRLLRLHLFESRSATFRDAKVLQENLITHSRREPRQAHRVVLTSSVGGDVQHRTQDRSVSTERIIDDSCGNMFIRIPENTFDLGVLDLVDAWPDRFTDLGLRVSTGPVVLFRSTPFLLDAVNERDAVPLISVHNVRPFETVWDVPKRKTAVGFKVGPRSMQLLVPAKNYVLLRRFSAKEERRRLVASCFLGRAYHREYVALENHLNYIYHGERELTEDEVYGVAALLNSALLDRYFRTISGNTQVNATELRTMHFPALPAVAAIGKCIRRATTIEPTYVERVVSDTLGLNGRVRQYVEGLSL